MEIGYEAFTWTLVGGALALIICNLVYPLAIKGLRLFGLLKKKVVKEDVMAASGRPKIKIEYNVLPNDKSKLINDMKTVLENVIDRIDDTVDPEDPGQKEIPFIPEDDEEEPDLGVEVEEGPDVKEDEEPVDEVVEVSYVRLGDL